MMKLINKLGVLIASIALSTVLVVPWSHSGSQLTDAEIAMLPEYCQARWSGKEEMSHKNWSQRMGASNFVHIHHFCVGLHFMSRAAIEPNPKNKKFLLGKAINNFDYVLARWPKEFSLTPAAANYRQQAGMMLGSIR